MGGRPGSVIGCGRAYQAWPPFERTASRLVVGRGGLRRGAEAHSTPTMCAAAARVPVFGSPTTRGRGPRPVLRSSRLPASGPVIARAFAERRASASMECGGSAQPG